MSATHIVVHRKFGIRISEEEGLGAEQLGLLRRGPLHFAILLRRDGSMPFFTQRETQESAAAAVVDVLSDRRAHGEQGVSGMRNNRQDFSRHASW